MKKNHFTGKYFVILLATTLILAVFIAFKFANSNSYRSDPITTEVNKINNQSSDTQVTSIEEDLNDTEFDNLDEELQEIDSQLNTSM